MNTQDKALSKNSRVLSRLLRAVNYKQRARIAKASKQYDRITSPAIARDRGY